jgi:dipeptidyl aminopeptidase/acylaminoacyl peptidase
MTANLPAHGRLIRAGAARSGAYNRTLTPFAFPNEQRTFWEVREIHEKMSPFFFARKIEDPILLIHGEADNSSGTFPIQSERFYMALKGNGKTVRHVTLPLEAHGYASRESNLHVLSAWITWSGGNHPSACRPAGALSARPAPGHWPQAALPASAPARRDGAARRARPV